MTKTKTKTMTGKIRYKISPLVLMIKSPDIPTILPTFFNNKIDALLVFWI